MFYNNKIVNFFTTSRLYVLLGMSLMVGIISPSAHATGAVITEYPSLNANAMPLQVAVDSASAVWFGEYNIGDVIRFQNGVMTPITISPASGPMDLWANPQNGDIWLSSSGNYIVEISSRGHVTDYAIPSSRSMPMGTTGDSQGNLWFSEEFTNKIGVVRTNGQISEYTIPTAASKPTGLTVDQYDNVWFAESATDKIGRLSSNLVFSEYPVSTGSKPLGINYWSGQKSQTLIWFTASSGNQIGSITQDGVVTTYTVPTAASSPEMIMEDALGNVWFTELQSSKIGRLMSDHASITEYATPTPSSGPMGLAVNPSDNTVWFAETQGNNIAHLVPTN